MVGSVNSEESVMPIKTHIALLTLSVIIHTVFGISSILFIALFSFGKSYKILDIIVLLTSASFLIFRRCIMVDIYERIRNKEINLPDKAKDSFFRNLFQRKILRRKRRKQRDLTSLRLDILNNTKPFIECNNQDFMISIYNQKTHYITINMIIVTILLTKYKLQKFLPLLILWIFTVFPL